MSKIIKIQEAKADKLPVIVELNGYCACNEGHPEIDNISFEKTKQKALAWNRLYDQIVRRCKVIIYAD